MDQHLARAAALEAKLNTHEPDFDTPCYAQDMRRMRRHVGEMQAEADRLRGAEDWAGAAWLGFRIWRVQDLAGSRLDVEDEEDEEDGEEGAVVGERDC
jgi:hypothetical protein